ncbi:hypothetical protein [Streptomyces mirabilis]|uniref:hypothetical protein n=1 Tax=Streptomyces mirabilis TaxID=68239 RepID=UPI00364BFD03
MGDGPLPQRAGAGRHRLGLGPVSWALPSDRSARTPTPEHAGAAEQPQRPHGRRPG